MPAEESVISLTTVADVISVGYTHNLAALEPDLRGSEKHTRRLSVCVHNACPGILVPPMSISDTELSAVWVEEFGLHVTPVIGKHSQLCYGDNGEEADLYTFEQLAKTMLSSMARPRIVRVVSHDHSTPKSIDIAYYLRVYDAIADTAKLAECVPWSGQPLSLRSFERRLENLF
ncbi:hypothetical protein BJY01DRAFT_252689 [Aspergillus pseudoustus]|uniref:Uncharacterized protein n=1 Tax=Aspergillus pseudoustus TaxID=1810923 RepID=A0ABR4J5T3_9EURO